MKHQSRTELLFLSFEAFKEHNTLTNKQNEDVIAQKLNLSDDERNVLTKNGNSNQFDYHLAWNRTRLKIIGIIKHVSRGVWEITEYGKSIPNAEAFKKIIDDRNNSNHDSLEKDVDDNVEEDVDDNVEEDVDDIVEVEYNRKIIEPQGKKELSAKDLYRYTEFKKIAEDIKRYFNVSFDVDHTKSINEYGNAAIHPNNLQLLQSVENKIKNTKSVERVSFEIQKEHIYNIVVYTRLLTRPVNDDDLLLLNTILNRLESVY